MSWSGASHGVQPERKHINLSSFSTVNGKEVLEILDGHPSSSQTPKTTTAYPTETRLVGNTQSSTVSTSGIMSTPKDMFGSVQQRHQSSRTASMQEHCFVVQDVPIHSFDQTVFRRHGHSQQRWTSVRQQHGATISFPGNGRSEIGNCLVPTSCHV